MSALQIVIAIDLFAVGIEKNGLSDAINIFLHLLAVLFYINEFPTKDGSTPLVSAQQHLRSAQTAVEAQMSGTQGGAAPMIMLTQYCSALYAITANDLASAARLLAAACNSLREPSSGMSCKQYLKWHACEAGVCQG